MINLQMEAAMVSCNGHSVRSGNSALETIKGLVPRIRRSRSMHENEVELLSGR